LAAERNKEFKIIDWGFSFFRGKTLSKRPLWHLRDHLRARGHDLAKPHQADHTDALKTEQIVKGTLRLGRARQRERTDKRAVQFLMRNLPMGTWAGLRDRLKTLRRYFSRCAIFSETGKQKITLRTNRRAGADDVSQRGQRVQLVITVPRPFPFNQPSCHFTAHQTLG
jgi:hypothetical protein